MKILPFVLCGIICILTNKTGLEIQGGPNHQLVTGPNSLAFKVFTTISVPWLLLIKYSWIYASNL